MAQFLLKFVFVVHGEDRAAADELRLASDIARNRSVLGGVGLTPLLLLLHEHALLLFEELLLLALLLLLQKKGLLLLEE